MTAKRFPALEKDARAMVQELNTGRPSKRFKADSIGAIDVIRELAKMNLNTIKAACIKDGGVLADFVMLKSLQLAAKKAVKGLNQALAMAKHLR